MLEALQFLENPHAIMIDPNENKGNKVSQTFYFFDVAQKVILYELNLELNGRCFLQVVNLNDKVFLIERQIFTSKAQ